MECNLLIFTSLFIITLVNLYSSRIIPEVWRENDELYDTDQKLVASEKQDQGEEPSNENSHQGRVQIKVYRGPDTQNENDHFAPYGFWVKQPADGH